MNGRSVKGVSILVGLVMSVFSCNMQYHMLYYPSSYVPSEKELAANNLQFWPAEKDYCGFIGTTEIRNIKGTVIVFHGNAGTADHRAYYVTALGSMGYRVILAEYPGYGARKGELGERSFVNDAQATVRLISQRYAEPIFLLGESLGCGVVAAAAKDKSLRIDALILITPWDALLAVAESLYPLLPVGLFLKDKYDSVENLKSFRGKVAVIGAERDEVLPIRHANALYGSLTGDKKMWVIKGAGHNDWPMFVDAKKWQEFMDFVQGRFSYLHPA
jgi:pimeloyl-ACP methyl ester carboxylesterase